MSAGPLVLVTNDDGFDAPGLHALVEAMNPLGRIVVVAPDREQSATSHSLTLHVLSADSTLLHMRYQHE